MQRTLRRDGLIDLAQAQASFLSSRISLSAEKNVSAFSSRSTFACALARQYPIKYARGRADNRCMTASAIHCRGLAAAAAGFLKVPHEQIAIPASAPAIRLERMRLQFMPSRQRAIAAECRPCRASTARSPRAPHSARPLAPVFGLQRPELRNRERCYAFADGVVVAARVRVQALANAVVDPANPVLLLLIDLLSGAVAAAQASAACFASAPAHRADADR